MRHLLFYSLMSFFCFTACQSAETPKNMVETDQALIEPIVLDTFNRIPTEMMGCGSVVYSSDFALQQRKYLLVSGRDTATIFVDGAQVMLHLADEDRDGASLRKTYQGGGYKVYLDLQTTEQLPNNVLKYKGDLLVERQGASLRCEINAVSGC